MKRGRFSRHALAASGIMAALVGAVAAAPAQAKKTPTLGQAAKTLGIDTSSCFDPTLSQPFLAWNDDNDYTLAPGESDDNFDGTGWTLTGGASIVQQTLLDGGTGSVLDLPSGSSAVSPPMCVTTDYPTARTIVRDVTGHDGVQFAVSYLGTKSWENPQVTDKFKGKDTGWGLSNDIKLSPLGGIVGWQIVRFTFTPGAKSGDYQLYDFYVDPRMRH